MKEKLYTIPLTDAFRANDECAFCQIERTLEQAALDYTLGNSSSYMQSDTREQTDALGFCRKHYKQMYLYGNTLGNALILQTHMKKFSEDFEKICKQYTPTPKMRFGKNISEKNRISSFLQKEKKSCFICNYIDQTFDRYLATFFYLLKKEDSFFTFVENSKGFCMDHLEKVMTAAPKYLSEKEQEKYMPTILKLSHENLTRVEDDLSWLIEKFDYRNVDADWKNAKDALPRSMQKIAGSYPADKPYINNRN